MTSRFPVHYFCTKLHLFCSGFVQQGGDSAASLVTASAALRLRDGFSHPHHEHMKDTYSLLTIDLGDVLVNLLEKNCAEIITSDVKSELQDRERVQNEVDNKPRQKTLQGNDRFRY